VRLVGLQTPLLIGGAVIMEQIFVIPGMGLLLLEAVGPRDCPIITGVFLVIGVCVVLINLLVDLSYLPCGRIRATTGRWRRSI
jgi:peptide/nickel transport system permease protein